MRKFVFLSVVVVLLSLSACGGKDDAKASDEAVTLNVVTTYGEGDGNRQNYVDAYKEFERSTGNVVNDNSQQSNEKWKETVGAMFTGDNEPDVLFYFVGTDANAIVAAGRVVPISEIRQKYSDYASNMKEGMLPASPQDGKQYAVPVNGYWEAMFVNKVVVAQAGVAIPDKDTTWDQFVGICRQIKDAGFVPIAASLKEVPHYWFEYSVFNHTSISTHTNLPATSLDDTAIKWSAGLLDIKDLFERGFFPENTLTAGDSDTFQLMADNVAAFAIDGSWKVGWFEKNVSRISDFTVTYVPSYGLRKSTDLIAGLSSGYYITRTAWDSPKRTAAVKFVKAMTQDSVVSKFGVTSVTALKNGISAPENANALVLAALELTRGVTGTASAAQDGLTQEQRDSLFSDISKVVTGEIAVVNAIEDALNKK